MSSESRPDSIYVDREMCQTAATCLAYSVYELDDEAKAVLLTRNGLNSDDTRNDLIREDGFVAIKDLVNSENLDLAKLQEMALESAKVCPFNAIIVKDQNGNQIWPPLD